MFSWKEAWFEKVVLMDVGIQLRQVVCRYLVYERKCAIKHRLLSKNCFHFGKTIFILYSKVINLRLTNAEYILVSSCYGT